MFIKTRLNEGETVINLNNMVAIKYHEKDKHATLIVEGHSCESAHCWIMSSDKHAVKEEFNRIVLLSQKVGFIKIDDHYYINSNKIASIHKLGFSTTRIEITGQATGANLNTVSEDDRNELYEKIIKQLNV